MNERRQSSGEQMCDIYMNQIVNEIIVENIRKFEVMKAIYGEKSLFNDLRRLSLSVPYFWYYALRNSGFLAMMHTNEKDKKVLQYLVDIDLTKMKQRVTTIQLSKQLTTQYTLNFYFAKNPYFNNEKLSLVITSIISKDVTIQKKVDIEGDGINWLNNFAVNRNEKKRLVRSFFDLFTSDDEDMKKKQYTCINILVRKILVNALHYFKNEEERVDSTLFYDNDVGNELTEESQSSVGTESSDSFEDSVENPENSAESGVDAEESLNIQEILNESKSYGNYSDAEMIEKQQESDQ